jgi:hypothetical protein
MKEISLKEVMAEIEALDREHWRSRLKCLIELLASSCLLIFWISLFFGQLSFPIFLRSLMIIQPILNACAWILWAMPSFYLHQRYRLAMEDSWREDLEGTNTLKRYEMRMYGMARQKRTERMIDLLTASQFIVLTIAIALSTIML